MTRLPLLRHVCIVVASAAALIHAGAASAQSRSARPEPPRDATLTTKDGVHLRITYYPSTEGQDAVPVVMLHDFAETRAVFSPLARALQNPRNPDTPGPQIAPRAVITVDLRGHGQSKNAVGPGGGTIELDAARFEVIDFEAMVVQDMEAVRSFLVEQNDAGNLNLNKLCVVGSGMGANVAMLWAARDWAMPALAVRKQGQDVKALALISPQWNFRGLILRDAMKFPPIQQQISVFLAYGRADRKIAKDCENIRDILARFHPEPLPDRVQQEKDFFVYDPDTRLQATKLLNSPEFSLGPKVASFIEARVGSRNLPWIQRKRP